MKYELFYLIAGSRETELDTIKAGAQAIVTAEGGVFDEKEVVERRKMAYQIKHETHGFYVARRFDLENPEGMQELIKKMNLYTSILRFVFSRADELPELKSREEMKNETLRKETTSPAKEVKKDVPAKAPIEVKKPVETKKEEVQPAEDIDKKLEEILNI